MRLHKRLVEFRQKDYEEHKHLFRQLGASQNPHTLFIGCCDSRLVPNLITRTLPGELFVVRNIANIVPANRKTKEFVATTSAVEYAVKVLGVTDIVVCGHSNCGGCNAIYWPERKLRSVPHTRHWLEQMARVKEEVLNDPRTASDPAAREWRTEQANVVLQLENLLTYPFIRSAWKKKTLRLHGWHYIIETGEILAWDPKDRSFKPLN
jgi:carbonic anhydrase